MGYIEIEKVSKWYKKDHLIIKDLSLSVDKGEFLVIVGPSGCGKSTLLRMIAGLEEINSGVIKIGDKVVNDLSPADRDIAMVFQNYALYPHMNVYKNLSYGLKNRKVPKDIIEKKVKEISKLLQIEELLERKPSELSGGQRQRVAMGRAIIREPKAFLFDEPLSNLDAKLRHQMRVEIRKLHDKLGITSIYVTHDQVEAMTLADRIVILNNGKVEQVGTPYDIYKNPKSIFVAKFMGTPPMNIIKSIVKDQKIKIGDSFLPLCVDIDDNELYLGVRAEDISLKPLQEAIEMEVAVDMIEHLGGESLIYAKIEEQQIVIKSEIFINKDIEKIQLYIDQSKIYFFDKKSGKSISLLSPNCNM